jgi:hypothetical protein
VPHKQKNMVEIIELHGNAENQWKIEEQDLVKLVIENL